MKLQILIKCFEEPFSWRDGDRIQGSLQSMPPSRFYRIASTDTFYNGLIPSDQRFFKILPPVKWERSAQKMLLKIIENKSKVHNSRNKLIVSQVKKGQFRRLQSDSDDLEAIPATSIGIKSELISIGFQI
ncbi:hypothetical protein Tco_0078590 [Tanacetum coccineum]